MPLLSLESISLAFGLHPLLDNAGLIIERGERVCLLGRNGEGKSTLLKILTGETVPDGGTVRLDDGAVLSVLPQMLPSDERRTAYEVVSEAFPETGKLLAEFHVLSQKADEASLDRLMKVQDKLEALDGWRLDQKVNAILAQFRIDPDRTLDTLSGGWQRRVLLAKALVCEPDLLLLDEPTNHLDVPAIAWLEDTLRQFPGALLFVSHDRAFIRRLATRVVELDRGQLVSFAATYERYLELKEKALEEEERQNAEFDRRLKQEEAWIRQGIKARRTRNMGRVRALKSMREERRQRRERSGNASFAIEDAARSGKLVVEAKHASFGYGNDKPIIQDLNLTVMRGDKIGLIGENGTGKTTLVRLLLGELEPTSGQIRLGTNRSVAYFDQLRGELDDNLNALDNMAEGREFIDVNGQQKHVLGYLQDFLFSPERARSPVSVFSGGERARLMLAKLFSKPANILVLDEPTNDLDVETLELLESQLVEFSGTVIVISHDREFLDNVVTDTLFLDGSGKVAAHVGGYSDWRRQGGQFPAEAPAEPAVRKEKKEEKSRKTSGKPAPAASRKLSYKLKLELEQLPDQIASLEADVEALQAQVSDPAFYSRPHEEVSRVLEDLAETEKNLEARIERWMELEEMAG
ncbi:ATP-binding cassette domain-containing protein [Marinobacter nanhaiticus D15-8W]|uniref:ATP-binding protein Uup n=1 Tax=Marinobacter nanhaiticus D15-8W TaxID=626887 RepID=N6W129_9GAMM|nr:ATP-binding cassette domain-containing protein [Marinobacter nanhaiticus]ENO13819.1 ATP-binding cassette domain-containing protein [Marinobacter nanhaiticus D15-8W]BES71193.1 ATP-binding cassette domain-containing protein [Marinobacter nanhaiticus D15-8W]